VSLARSPFSHASAGGNAHPLGGSAWELNTYTGSLELLSELGMLGAVSMREPWASMGIMRWATAYEASRILLPPARDVSLRIAHLHATASQVRFRTMAVATRLPEHSAAKRVCRKERERTGQENDSLQVESEQGRRHEMVC